jgi:glycosyltransferase involved in cell wall biosynthesis
VRIALDATYSVDPYPSGIAVYSREILDGLAAAHPNDSFLHCYRPKQFRKARRPRMANVERRLLLPPLPTFEADIFHALNQRVDHRPAKKVVTTFHDLFVMTAEYSTPEFRMRFSQQARQAAANSDFIIAVSEFTAGQVNELLNVPRSRIRVIPHGVRTPEVASNSAREKIILFVGTLQVRKNVARLVRAFEALPKEWQLILAGSPHGFGAETILQQIEASPSRDRIRVTGYITRTELSHLYSRASIFAFPSLGEGFGMPVLEAMAHGLPVITSKHTALAEVAGGAAYLVDPGNSEEIEQALTSLIKDGQMRSRLIELGRQRAASFSWDRALAETYGVYFEMTANGTADCSL